MKIQQTRKVLVAAAAMHAKLGDAELATALTELADILKPYEKGDLEEFVARVAKLRATKPDRTNA
jgi:hypothetical protein